MATYLVTGGNAGIGYFVAERLAATGATVLIGARNADKAALAVTAIRARVPDATLRHVPLDLADLDSVLTAAEQAGVVDGVVLNAGAMVEGARRTTTDGNELMFATNHLGHFALVNRLQVADGGRIVTTGSLTARGERLDFADLQTANGYKTMRAYARSKLAQMIAGFELDRRLRAAGSKTISVVTHPGGALDSLTPSRPPVHTRGTALAIATLPARLMLHGKDAAAESAVHALLAQDVTGGQLWAPRFTTRGKPHLEKPRPHMVDQETAARLWELSEVLVDAGH